MSNIVPSAAFTKLGKYARRRVPVLILLTEVPLSQLPNMEVFPSLEGDFDTYYKTLQRVICSAVTAGYSTALVTDHVVLEKLLQARGHVGFATYLIEAVPADAAYVENRSPSMSMIRNGIDNVLGNDEYLLIPELYEAVVANTSVVPDSDAVTSSLDTLVASKDADEDPSSEESFAQKDGFKIIGD